MRNSSTFEITIQRKSGDSWPIVVEHSRPGVLLPLRSEGTLKLRQDNFNELLSQIGQPRDYGTRLGKALFRDEVRDAFAGALRDSHEPLRVLLFIEADSKELKTMRWERLCAPIDGDWHLLALDQRTPFSLYIPATTDRRFPPIGRRDLRALVLVASPSGLGRYHLDPFDVEATVASVKSALGEIPCDVLATVDGAIGPPTLDELCEQLTDRKKQYTLLHFVCHGKLIKNGETVLYWAKADKQVEAVEGTRLLERLRPLRGPRGLPHFAFLSTCESASPGAEVALGGLAQRLVRDLGMPAVVAMTEKVTVKTAQALAESFYRRLRESGEVDLALNEATAGLAERHDINVPALFSRLGGRPLFSDQLDRDLTNSEIQFGLERLQKLLFERAPVLRERFDEQAAELGRTLGADATALSVEARQEREQALVEVNNICDEVLDLSFNALALGQKPPDYDPRCPFLGLYPFRVEDREFFFGRESLIEQLQQKLAEHNFLAVLGPSGSGKSSVVLAGLIPRLQSKEKDLQMVYLTPSSEPLVQLKASLSNLPDQPSVLVVDQFEELFTLCTDEAKRVEFIDQLLTLAQKQRVVITMRADFWGECATYRELKELMEARQKLIAPMDSTELRKAMEMQAAKVGLRFEAGLSNSILDDVQGEPGAMPLLQHALLELWKRRHGRWLRYEEYRAIGGVQQAIAKTADDVYNSLSRDEQEQVRNIFVRLTRLDENAIQGEKRRDTRRRVWLEELVPAGGDLAVTKKLVKRLAGEGARLVVTSVDGATNREEVEVAHEALIRYWPRLLNWLEENRSSLQLRETIRQAALEWDKHKREESYLVHQGGRLEDAEALSRQPRLALNKFERDYVEACVELRERLRSQEEERRQRELEQERKALKAAKNTIRVAIASLVFVTGFAFFAGIQWIESEKQLIISTSSYSKLLSASNQEFTALIASLRAGTKLHSSAWVKNDTQVQTQVVTTLQEAVYGVRERNSLEEHNGAVHGVSFSPNGQTLASVSADDTIKLWNQHGRLRRTLTGHSGTVYSVSFSPDGQTLASASADDTIKLWSQDGTLLKTLTEHNGAVYSVSFSPDGQTLASASADNTIKLWNQHGGLRRTLTEHSGAVSDVSFSPDGQTLASASTDNTIKLWNQDGTLLKTITGYKRPVLSVGFSPDGQVIAATSEDGTIQFWSKDGTRLKRLFEDSVVHRVIFSPDGQTIASVGGDTTVKLWNPDGSLLQNFQGHRDGVYGVSFSPDGQMIASASADGTVKLWNRNSILLHTIQGHNGDVYSALFSPDDQMIASVGSDNTVKLWHRDGTLFKTLAGHTDLIHGVSFSPDGQTIASASWDKTIKLWSSDGSLLKTLAGHSGRVYGVKFNPDGQTIVSASGDGTLKLWSRDGTLLKTLRGHTDVAHNVSFSSDGQIMASASHDKTVKLWSSQDGTLIKTLRGHTNWVHGVSFSPDGQTIASASHDKTVKLWRRDGTLIKTLIGHTDKVLGVSFSSNGQMIASSGQDKTVKLWRLDGTLIATLRGHGNWVHGVSFSSDDQTLASASYDNTVILWNLENLDNLDVLLTQGCDWVRNYLQTNPKVSKSDKRLCDGVGTQN